MSEHQTGSALGARKASIRERSRREDLAAARPFAVPLLIWGAQWLASAVLEFCSQWRDTDAYRQDTLWAALVLTVLWLALSGLRSRQGASGSVSEAVSRSAVPFLLAAGAFALLLYAQTAAWLLLPLLRGVVLAAGYMAAGLKLGKPLLLLGIWMLVLTGTTGFWYLGYASMALGGFGGLSLMTAAWMISLWNRGEQR